MRGELDLATVDAAHDTIRLASGEADHVVCDLAALWFIDVSGVHVLVDAAIAAREAGTYFGVANCPPIVPRILRVLRLDDVLEIISLAPSLAPLPATGRPNDYGTLRLVPDSPDPSP